MGTNIRKRPILRAFLTFSICPLKCPFGNKTFGRPDRKVFQRGDKFVPVCLFAGTKCQKQAFIRSAWGQIRIQKSNMLY